MEATQIRFKIAWQKDDEWLQLEEAVLGEKI